MPRPMLKKTQQAQTQAADLLSAVKPQQRQQQQQQIDKMKLDRLLRRPRSKAYMEALHRLDAGGHAHNQQKVDEIIPVSYTHLTLPTTE